MDKLASRVASRFLAAADLPQVVEKTEMVPRKFLVCPHCQQEIHEKGLYNDGTNWFHRAATCKDKPMAMPPPKENVSSIFRNWGLR